MNRRLLLASTLSLTACSRNETSDRPSADAQVGATGPLSREAIETAAYAPAPTEGPANPAQLAQPQPALIRAQILLERARFSPGAIDGLEGSSMRQAVAAYQKANDLPTTGRLDAGVLDRLRRQGPGPVTAAYRITQADLDGPYLGVVPTDLEAQGQARTWGTPIS
ncbi:peptidoglycan-binding domain-containing protein [Brevundimonas sp. SORGH_AS_0993]|uniref:peptidoglycan-binding domain-containing protein n=1 Tax=Brevundimonas sp. SORGH_AS_0993 TaxID=3041794 RepID=UPI002788767B|nr:peptidoglycan-binding domain-containing protein [Brevundimonas sp. SORGH_AS_0993]MDQ1153913.1 peptidoglycan hydrolase-like protein with peptidoglycan-binding domain [Brevundimonas sp. SORGH_AS_0993]